MNKITNKTKKINLAIKESILKAIDETKNSRCPRKNVAVYLESFLIKCEEYIKDKPREEYLFIDRINKLKKLLNKNKSENIFFDDIKNIEYFLKTPYSHLISNFITIHDEYVSKIVNDENINKKVLEKMNLGDDKVDLYLWAKFATNIKFKNNEIDKICNYNSKSKMDAYNRNDIINAFKEMSSIKPNDEFISNYINELKNNGIILNEENITDDELTFNKIKNDSETIIKIKNIVFDENDDVLKYIIGENEMKNLKQTISNSILIKQ